MFTDPVVTVLSTYVPSALAVKVPVVVSVPVTGTLGQPRLKYQPSMSPAKAKQEDDETVQVPTTEPPHGVTSGQDGPAPPVPPAPLPPEPGLEQAEAKVNRKSPTPRNPNSACLIGELLASHGRDLLTKGQKSFLGRAAAAVIGENGVGAAAAPGQAPAPTSPGRRRARATRCSPEGGGRREAPLPTDHIGPRAGVAALSADRSPNARRRQPHVRRTSPGVRPVHRLKARTKAPASA